MAGLIGRYLCLHAIKARIIVLISILVILITLYKMHTTAASPRSGTLTSSSDSLVVPARDMLTQSVRVAQSSPQIAKSRKFPTVLIIGVKKGGTRALLNMLRSHPEIVTATTEVHYFDQNENFDKGVQWYVSNMPLSTAGQITIEKSPRYFVSPHAPQRIAAASPNMKLILIVRNPIDRTISDYTQLAQRNLHRSFEGAIFKSPSGEINTRLSIISVSMYDVHIKGWLEYFNLSQIHLLNGDILISNPVRELKRAEEFLKVKSYFTEDMFYFNSTKGFYCWKKEDRHGDAVVPYCLGSGKGRHHLQILNSTRQRLLEFFEPHNERFFSQVHQRFNWR